MIKSFEMEKGVYLNEMTQAAVSWEDCNLTLVELFLYLMALVCAIAGAQGGWSHGVIWAILGFPVGLVVGVVGTLPLISFFGLGAVTLLPLEEYLNQQKQFPFSILARVMETISGILLFAFLVLVPWGGYVVVFGLVDGVLRWLGG